MRPRITISTKQGAGRHTIFKDNEDNQKFLSRYYRAILAMKNLRMPTAINTPHMT